MLKLTSFFAFAVIALSGCSIANPGSGEKVGQITRVVDEGLACTTHTVVITGKFGGSELKLTAPNHLLADVRKYQDSQEMVKVQFHTSFIASACSNDTDNVFMDSIAPHKEGSPAGQ
jgi:hypothetical protein